MPVAFSPRIRTNGRMTLTERLQRYLDAKPQIHPTAFVAPGADIVGDVTLAEESSVWFQTVLRGDINRIVIGPRSNVQDGAVVHLADDYGVFVGELVTVGHKAILHACTVADEVLVGMGAIILDGAEIGARSIIGAGALVTGGKKDPAGFTRDRFPGKSRAHPFAPGTGGHQNLGGEIRRRLPRLPRALRGWGGRENNSALISPQRRRGGREIRKGTFTANPSAALSNSSAPLR